MWAVYLGSGAGAVVASTYVWHWWCRRKRWVTHREWPAWAYPLFLGLVAYRCGEQMWGPARGAFAVPLAYVGVLLAAGMASAVAELRAYARVQRRERGQ